MVAPPAPTPSSGASAPAHPEPPEAPLEPLLGVLREEPGLVGALGRRSTVLVLPDAARAASVAGLTALSTRRPIVVAVPAVADAERLAGDLRAFLPRDAVELFPSWETLPFERVSPSIETMGQRLRVMWRLRAGDDSLQVVVAPARALAQRLGPEVEDVEPIVVRPGDRVDQQQLVERLVLSGYRREYQVEHRGEVAVRGSIVDVFPSTADRPVRIDLWGDEVDRLAEFSVADQRSGTDLAQVELHPARELLPTDAVRERAERLIATDPWGREQWQRLADGEVFEGMEAWLPWLVEHGAVPADGSPEHVLLDLLGPDGLVLLVEPRRLRDRVSDVLAEEADLGSTLARTWGLEDDHDLPRLHVDLDRLLAHTEAPTWSVAAVPDAPDTPAVASSTWPPAVGGGEALLAQLRQLVGDGYRVVVCADGAGSAVRLQKLISEHGLTFPVLDGDGDGSVDAARLLAPGGKVVVAPIDRGCILPGVQLALLAEADLTGRRRTHRPPRAPRRDAQRFYEDLKVGDYVVHQHHGVARFAGMVERTMGGAARDYLLLEYRGDDKLYVPSEQIDAIRLYSGGETPSLNRMGGADFARTKAKVRSAVAEIAQELVVLYQKRQAAPGHAFAEDTPWQREMEAAFPFQETPDQLTAIRDVKEDMESTVPMDRLVCGDVGFGKTEVAVRAAFKAVQDGKQVAILVPTTLLAQQHFQTFSDRFAGYPVRVEVLSRFLTNAQAREVTEGLASGAVDVVIGTHRLLSGDVAFQRLGLLVVDEEQRFGVSHKEAIKQMKADVDVLTLSATPIPRTLEMSLTGIRDLSLLNTPPAARQPILTYVGEYDERAVAEAIRRELLREGQVFYVHNRVRDIEEQAARIRELVPEARIAVAHGQMDEGTLERVVLDFWEGAFDVLVCTTIIESGIDMPTVNTLVVERADLLGLGQLHQIRGRVGRSGQRAYAYLFFPPERQLSEEAYERLKTIGETTELGSGFRIAMRDLEIRGAGNLLGTGQTGHVAAVGYDLYVQMVNEAIAQLNGEPVVEAKEITLELPLPAHLPADYVERDDLRLDAYRRLAAVQTQADVDDIADEWVDRFGPVPDPAANLLAIARLRAECVRTGVEDVAVTKASALSGPGWVARISPIRLPQSKQMRLARLYKGAVYKEEQSQLQLPVKAGASLATDLVEALQQLLPPPADEG
ncbi:transcription-repair coupling factor [Dermatobacter hominis]|uniref:transcription-repair coupling factor n=1 Tax=Dermatobacter hominis TaxID=2884263 RepID=UPI001D128FD2|nr:transcription-repair coupling factor [Dermatobacter hominis]UDY37696.1 transcription-repair coupling factor [Dermatobacter hominis]